MPDQPPPAGTAMVTPGLAAAENPHLLTALQMAVPLQIETLRDQPDWALDALRTAVADRLQQGGDAMQFGGDGAGMAFAAHVRALAYLALTAEGGVDFAGLHWCAIRCCRASTRLDHADDTPAAEPPPPTPPRPITDIHLPDGSPAAAA
jgi:hypothetical protein